MSNSLKTKINSKRKLQVHVCFVLIQENVGFYLIDWHNFIFELTVHVDGKSWKIDPGEKYLICCCIIKRMITWLVIDSSEIIKTVTYSNQFGRGLIYLTLGQNSLYNICTLDYVNCRFVEITRDFHRPPCDIQHFPLIMQSLMLQFDLFYSYGLSFRWKIAATTRAFLKHEMGREQMLCLQRGIGLSNLENVFVQMFN